MKNAWKGLLLFAVVIVMFSGMILSGCGRSKAKESLKDNLKIEQSKKNSSKKKTSKNKTKKEKKNTETEKAEYESEDSGEGAKFKHFDVSPDWKKYKLRDQPVQIDDTVYVPGMTVKDFLSTVDSSSVDYTYEYNEDKLINVDDIEIIKVYRDNYAWFYVYAQNIFEEVKPFSDILVYCVEVCDDAMEYSYFIDGKSIKDFFEMSYSDVKEYGDALSARTEDEYIYELAQVWQYPDYFWLDSENSDKDYDTGEEYIALNYTHGASLEKAKWTGYRVNPLVSYTFCVDKNTSKVARFYRRAENPNWPLGAMALYEWPQLD